MTSDEKGRRRDTGYGARETGERLGVRCQVPGVGYQGVKKNCRLLTAYCLKQVSGAGRGIRDYRFKIQNDGVNPPLRKAGCSLPTVCGLLSAAFYLLLAFFPDDGRQSARLQDGKGSRGEIAHPLGARSAAARGGD